MFEDNWRKREKKNCGRIVSGERGTNTTVVCCANAVGVFVPPMFIYKRKRIAPQLGNGAPADSLIEISDHSFITSELFVKWLQHFIDFVKPSTDNKVLLLLDGHTTHTKNSDALKLARANGIILVQLPAHTTHRLQPLDVGVFGPMQQYYDQALDQWMASNAGQCVTQFNVASIITIAYYKAASISNAVNAFQNTGCWPVNRFVFKNADFAPSDLLVTDNNNDTNTTTNNKDTSSTDTNTINNNNDTNTTDTTTTTTNNDTNTTDTNNNNSSNITHNELHIPTRKKKKKNPITILSPFPKPIGNRKRSAQKAVELTSETYMDTVANSKKKKKTLQKTGKTTKTKQLKKKIKQEDIPTTSSQIFLNTPSTKVEQNSITICTKKEEWFCFLCNESHVENMIQCIKCTLWVHDSCAGVLKKTKTYYCPNCFV